MSNKSTASNSIGTSYSYKVVHPLDNSEEKKVKNFSKKTPARKKPDITIRNLVKNAVSSMKAEETNAGKRMIYAREYGTKAEKSIVHKQNHIRNIKLTFSQEDTKLLAKLKSRDKLFLHISKKNYKREADTLSQSSKKSRNKEIGSKGTNPKEKNSLSKRSDSSYEDDCRTVIEHDCENDYSLICNTLNKVFPFY